MLANKQDVKKAKEKKPTTRNEENHYVRNVSKKQIAIDILDYQDEILEEIKRKTKHNKRSVLIAIIDYFIVDQKQWLDFLKVKYPKELKQMSLDDLTERFGFRMLKARE